MKATITFLILFFSITTLIAQVQITSYFGLNDYIFTNINPTTPLTHSAIGASAVWTFNSLPTNGTSSEVNVTPTASEFTTYPGTTSVHVTSTAAPSPSNVAKIYNKLTGTNAYSITGFDANGVILNYITNNALIGTFPLIFGYTNTDNTAGTFTSGVNTGTFTGTIKTDYDSYGTLNLGVDGFLPITKTVFRVKVFQNINLTIGFFPIGTVTQTSYTYYANNAGVIEPLFRDTSFTVNVPLLGDPQNTNQAQVISNSLTLGLDENIWLINKINFYPNPASNLLTIDNKSNQEIKSISLNDTNGRSILEFKSTSNQIDISNLSKGLYLVKIKTENGSIVKKLLKE